MNPRAYFMVTGIIFACVGAGHLVRAVLALPAEVGGWVAPVWLSWLGFPAAAALCVWAFSLARGPVRK